MRIAEFYIMIIRVPPGGPEDPVSVTLHECVDPEKFIVKSLYFLLPIAHIALWSRANTRPWVVGTRGFQGSLPCRSTESLVCWYLASRGRDQSRF